MSAFSTSETRDPNGSTASVARFTTPKHSSQLPSSSVNIDDVRCGRPESRTTFTAAATASETEPSARPVPDGATENATIMTEKPPVGVLSCGDVSSSKNSLLNPYPVALDRGEHGVRPVRQPAARCRLAAITGSLSTHHRQHATIWSVTWGNRPVTGPGMAPRLGGRTSDYGQNCQNRNCESSWSGRRGWRTWWPRTRSRPHNDGMTGSVVEAETGRRGRGIGRGQAARSEPGHGTRGAAAPPLLTVSGLSVSFGRIRALDNVTLSVRTGELVALAGENGAGKTTLVRCIAGDVVPASGEVFLAGRRVPADPAGAAKRGIAVVWQDLALCDNLDIAANIMLGRESRRLMLSETRFHTAAASLLSELRIPLKDTTRSVRWLSGGQRQLVAVARAMGRRPRLLALDEPTAN